MSSIPAQRPIWTEILFDANVVFEPKVLFRPKFHSGKKLSS